ncbi:effector-associated constant component EACC1 [Streptomyces sp. NPDC055239]
MRLVISVHEGSVEDELRSLYDWLMTDRTVRRGALAELASSNPPIAASNRRPSIFCRSYSAVASARLLLASASPNWRATRPQHPTVTVERPDGTKVSISGATPEAAQHLMHQLLNPEP